MQTSIVEESRRDRGWYLVYCKANMEETAEDNLCRQGYHVFLPMALVRRRRKTRYEIINAPLFPRYLFIHLCPNSDDWGPIRYTIGVSNMVRFGKVTAQVPNALVERLQLCADEGIIKKESVQFKCGDCVRIISGVAKDYQGMIISKSSRERVVLLLETVAGYTAKMQVPEAWLEEVT